jgi:hypothetical protein
MGISLLLGTLAKGVKKPDRLATGFLQIIVISSAKHQATKTLFWVYWLSVFGAWLKS